MTREEWMARLKETYETYRKITLTDKDCKELYGLLDHRGVLKR